jgi:hypothetical protein
VFNSSQVSIQSNFTVNANLTLASGTVSIVGRMNVRNNSSITLGASSSLQISGILDCSSCRSIDGTGQFLVIGTMNAYGTISYTSPITVNGNLNFINGNHSILNVMTAGPLAQIYIAMGSQVYLENQTTFGPILGNGMLIANSLIFSGDPIIPLTNSLNISVLGSMYTTSPVIFQGTLTILDRAILGVSKSLVVFNSILMGNVVGTGTLNCTISCQFVPTRSIVVSIPMNLYGQLVISRM